MNRAKKRKFMGATPTCFWPQRFTFENLRSIPNDYVDYDGPLIAGEIGIIEGFRFIESKAKK